MEFVTAHTLSEALAALRDRPDLQILAGGTDVMIQMQRAQLQSDGLLHIEALRDTFGNIETLDGCLRIGALTSHRALAECSKVNRYFPSLAQAAATVGGWQTQMVGTLVGNICNASPAADTAPPLMIHEANVVLESADGGVRRVAITDFMEGRRQTARRPGELVTYIELPLPEPGTRCCYLKVGRRKAMEVAIAGLALKVTLDQTGKTIVRARLATCAVGPVPQRVSGAEHPLVGQQVDALHLKAAQAALVASASPIDDTRSSAAYRIAVLPGLLERAVTTCLREPGVTTNGKAS